MKDLRQELRERRINKEKKYKVKEGEIKMEKKILEFLHETKQINQSYAKFC